MPVCVLKHLRVFPRSRACTYACACVRLCLQATHVRERSLDPRAPLIALFVLPVSSLRIAINPPSFPFPSISASVLTPSLRMAFPMPLFPSILVCFPSVLISVPLAHGPRACNGLQQIAHATPPKRRATTPESTRSSPSARVPRAENRGGGRSGGENGY